MPQPADPSTAALPTRLPRGRPKGHALRAILSELLAELPPGAELPSERELAERYGVARMTVRGVIERLAAQGLVYRLQGRATFVAAPRVAQAGALSSFTEDMAARGLTPGSIVRSSETMEADGVIAAQLELAPGHRVFHLERVRTADGRPMAVEHAYVPLRRFAGIERVDFAETSLFAVLGERFGVALRDAHQRVVAVSIGPEEAALLDVAEGEAGLRFHSLGRDGDGRPVYYAISLFSGAQYEVEMWQTRDGGT